MTNPIKQKPKACGCRMCHYGKVSEAGRVTRKKEERAFRHASKIDLLKGREDIPAAPHGAYLG